MTEWIQTKSYSMTLGIWKIQANIQLSKLGLAIARVQGMGEEGLKEELNREKETLRGGGYVQ